MASNILLAITVNHSSPEVCGVDESVTTPTNTNWNSVQKARVTLKLDNEKPLYKFKIYGEDEDVSYCFSSQPWFQGIRSPTGQATQVYIVYAPELNKHVLMKDTWRVSLRGMPTESDIYQHLQAANVSHIAHFVQGGDVKLPFCRTHSHKFANNLVLNSDPTTIITSFLMILVLI